MTAKSENSIPKNARRVFKGVIFEVWQWRQKMFDGSWAVFEKLKRPDSVEVIPIMGNKILIQTQRQPDWNTSFISLPGGVCDEGENPLEAAKRELLEETGYASKKWSKLKVMHPFHKIVWNVYSFIAKDCKFDKNPELDAGEKITTKLIAFDEFIMLSSEPRFRHKSISEMLLRARYDKKYRAELRKLFFS